MLFTSEFLQTILLLGFIQGTIGVVLLWRSSKRYAPNRILAAILALISLACLNSYFFHAAWFRRNNFLEALHAIIPLVIIMPVGPLLFFYVRGISISKKDRRHFLPVFIDFVPYLTALIYITGHFLKVFRNGSSAWVDFIDGYNAFADVPRWLSISVYLFAAWRIRSKAPRWLSELLAGFAAFQVIFLLYLVPYLLPGTNIRFLQTVGWYPVMVPLVALVYWMTFKAWLFAQQYKLPGRTVTSELQAVMASLNEMMAREKLYLDPQLQIAQVAEKTGLPTRIISTAINTCLGQNFNYWVSSYRVEAFKQRILQAEHSLTLAGIARECGFSSDTTFQRTFKQFTGMVPTAYKAHIKSQNEQSYHDPGVLWPAFKAN